MLASVSGTFEQSACQLCVWDLPQLVCKRSLTPKHCEVVSLAYSRDDRFLLSVGQFRLVSHSICPSLVLLLRSADNVKI